MWPCFCETNASLPGLMAVAVILSEVSSCLSEIFWSIRHGCEVRNVFLSWERSYKSKETRSVFWVESLTEAPYIPSENSQLQILKKKNKNFFFFLAVLKPIPKSLYWNRKHGCMFFFVHRTVFSQCMEMWGQMDLPQLCWVACGLWAGCACMREKDKEMLSCRGCRWLTRRLAHHRWYVALAPTWVSFWFWFHF